MRFDQFVEIMYGRLIDGDFEQDAVLDFDDMDREFTVLIHPVVMKRKANMFTDPRFPIDIFDTVQVRNRYWYMNEPENVVFNNGVVATLARRKHIDFVITIKLTEAQYFGEFKMFTKYQVGVAAYVLWSCLINKLNASYYLNPNTTTDRYRHSHPAPPKYFDFFQYEFQATGADPFQYQVQNELMRDITGAIVSQNIGIFDALFMKRVRSVMTKYAGKTIYWKIARRDNWATIETNDRELFKILENLEVSWRWRVMVSQSILHGYCVPVNIFYELPDEVKSEIVSAFEVKHEPIEDNSTLEYIQTYTKDLADAFSEGYEKWKSMNRAEEPEDDK